MSYALFSNLAIVAAFLFIAGQIFIKHHIGEIISKKNQLGFGIYFGIMGIILILYAIKVTTISIVDLRYVAIICSAVIGGPISVIVTSLIIAGFRLIRFGINTVAYIGAFTAIVVGLGCGYFSLKKLSLVKKFTYMFSFEIIMSLTSLFIALNDYQKTLGVFLYYIPLSFIGVTLAYFAVKYIDSRQMVEQQLKESEAELKRLNKNLMEKSLEADRQREEAIEANRHKSHFLATMSHELRTPLNSIIGFTNRVLKKCGTDLPEMQRENLIIVKEEANHLLELINDLLDFSKIEAGKLEIYPEEFDLITVMGEASVMTNNLIEDKHIKFELALPALRGMMIFSDKLKIKQILINLLSNAFKYSDKGTVTLSLNIEDEGYRIEVRDQGIGISPDNIQYVFKEFHQLDENYSRKVEGTGLGLYITKRFVELLKGEIEVESELGAGSTFIVHLPFRFKG